MTAKDYMLRFPNDAFTKSAFLGCARQGRTAGAVEEIDVSVGYGDRGGIVIDFGGDGRECKLHHLDLSVLAAISAIAGKGRPDVPINSILESFGYANPRAASMSGTAGLVKRSVEKMTRVHVEMPAVHASDGGLLYPGVARTPVISGELSGDALHLACDRGKPTEALPFLARAQQMRQVVGVTREQMPCFSGRRVALAQRQLALYLAVRVLERHTSNTVLVETLFRSVGIDFAADGAGSRRKSRCLAQLRSTLESMAEQGAVISAYEFERARADNSVRAIVLTPARRHGKHR